MSTRVRFFLFVEAVLAIYLAYQVISNPATLVFSILGVLALLWASSMKNRNFFRTAISIFGIIAMVVSIFINPTVWWMILVAVIALFVTGNKTLSTNGLVPWFRKQFVSVRSTADDGDRSNRTRPWFGDYTIGQSVFEWDDVNITVLTGDTIIDLGKTILPKRDNVVMIRKGFGKTRLLVPIGIGVEINHSAMVGKVDFADHHADLRNETVRLYSDDFDTAPRRIRIFTSAIIGDLEVVPV
mgnify:CR=1 FL=1